MPGAGHLFGRLQSREAPKADQNATCGSPFWPFTVKETSQSGPVGVTRGIGSKREAPWLTGRGGETTTTTRSDGRPTVAGVAVFSLHWGVLRGFAPHYYNPSPCIGPPTHPYRSGGGTLLRFGTWPPQGGEQRNASNFAKPSRGISPAGRRTGKEPYQQNREGTIPAEQGRNHTSRRGKSQIFGAPPARLRRA